VAIISFKMNTGEQGAAMRLYGLYMGVAGADDEPTPALTPHRLMISSPTALDFAPPPTLYRVRTSSNVKPSNIRRTSG
jgi:hypothetical protein